MRKPLIVKYQRFLELKKKERVISLQEGGTPLIAAERLAAAIGFPGEIFLKFEGTNPTGSFKDRGMTYAMTKALGRGAKTVVCASTGNTSASAAAYAAHAGVRCIVVIPEGKVALGKLSQAAMHGAEILKIQGNFDEALTLVQELAGKYPIALVNSVNPDRLEGQKTAAFEVCDELGDAPHFHALPVGNAGNITAYWKGYREYKKAKRSKRLPRMLGFQAAGAAPLVHGKPVAKPETIATAIRIGNPASWQGAIAARDQSKGLIQAVTDDEILAAYDLVAKTEGVFCEPACAAALAGVARLVGEGFFPKRARLVCTLTGHGLKDPETAMSRTFNQQQVSGTLEAVVSALRL